MLKEVYRTITDLITFWTAIASKQLGLQFSKVSKTSFYLESMHYQNYFE